MLFRSKVKNFLSWTVISLVFWLLAFSWNSPNLLSTSNNSLNFKLPLSTLGSQIVDAAGQPVLLRGVNWFGIETEMHVPHGLWSRDYREMLSQIKNLGYNIIRLPYSVESLKAGKSSGIDYKIGVNKDLEGKTPLEVMDLIIQEAERQGILILLDSHRLNSQRIPELWYGDGFTEADWIDTWKMLATRYKNQANVIGADLKNEPHGKASWGTNDLATDWRLAAERAGNAILTINPNWLIVVEGVEKNVPEQKLAGHWQGGNLEGVKRFPVRLSVPNKIVYSPHEYGPGVFNQPWFSEPNFPQNLQQRWEIGFNYIARERIAPVWIGEFGGRQVDENSKEGVWQRLLVNYIDNQKLGFAYWSWNPNSGDTGGILLDDWLNIDIPKQRLLSKLLPPGNFIPNSNPTPNAIPTASPSSPIPTPTPKPSPDVSYNFPASSSANLKAETIVQSDWQTGFCVTMRVTNPSNTSITNWRLGFTMNQAAINNSWNGTFVPKGSQYQVIPPDWAKVIQPNQIVDMGFCANKLGADYRPRGVAAFSASASKFPAKSRK